MITFFVPGIPIAKGSAKGFVVKSKGTGKMRAIITQTNGEKQKPWASLIGVMGHNAGLRPVSGPVAVTLVFHMPRPASHYGTGKNASILKSNSPVWHTSKPDTDKLERCVWDALTGVAWNDDSQVVVGRHKKIYHERPGVIVQVQYL